MELEGWGQGPQREVRIENISLASSLLCLLQTLLSRPCPLVQGLLRVQDPNRFQLPSPVWIFTRNAQTLTAR